MTIKELENKTGMIRANIRWKMWQGRKLGLDGRDCAWDDDEGYRYTKEERRIGRWREQADGNGYGGTVQTQVNGVWTDLEEPVWDEPEFTLEDGHVTAVTLRVSGDCIDYLPSVQREMLMLLALSGSTENWSLLDPDVDGWLTAADEVLDQFGDGETQQRGLRVTKREELSGYQETEEFFFLTPVVGEEQCYERVVTISLVQ